MRFKGTTDLWYSSFPSPRLPRSQESANVIPSGLSPLASEAVPGHWRTGTNRGRGLHNAFPEAAAAAVVKMAGNGCTGANRTLLPELLWERWGMDLSGPTVHPILAKAGRGTPRCEFVVVQ